ncbi:hypothetical protein LCGC14_1466810 [marine sediment metagenome]|uniref:Macro domain-containing protein n=1 Tax=marine sediment metagenome TaxID=412755 RepID=A0A0F9JZI8_9ZZZZ
MKTHKGNMWSIYKEADYFVFTGNSFIKNNHALVMGRGMAKQIRDRIPGIDLRIGKRILKKGPSLCRYGFIHIGKIGVFQVKHTYMEIASLALIEYSTKCLSAFAARHHNAQIHMNYPGIGYGKLTKAYVSPIIKRLPNNVHIWTF